MIHRDETGCLIVHVGEVSKEYRESIIKAGFGKDLELSRLTFAGFPGGIAFFPWKPPEEVPIGSNLAQLGTKVMIRFTAIEGLEGLIKVLSQERESWLKEKKEFADELSPVPDGEKSNTYDL